MNHKKRYSFLSPDSDYKYMMLLKNIFSSPRNLLYFPSLSFSRKKRLLKRWRDERTRYILENCRDLDYMTDKDMDDLLISVKIVKAVLSAEEENQVRIRINHGGQGARQ